MGKQRPSPDPAAGLPPIRIRDRGACAEVHHVWRGLLAGVLAKRRRFGAVAGVEPEYLFDLDAGGVLHVPSGLVPRLAEAARRAGHAVEVEDLAERPVPAGTSDLAGLDDDHRRLAAHLAIARRGVVVAGSAAERVAVIAMAARVFPAGLFMVMTKTRKQAGEIEQGPARNPSASWWMLHAAAHPLGRPHPGRDARRPGPHRRRGRRLRRRVAGPARARPPLDVVPPAPADLRTARRALGLSRRERLVIEGYIGPVIGRLGPPEIEPVRYGLFSPTGGAANGRTSPWGCRGSEPRSGRTPGAMRRSHVWGRPWPPATWKRRGRTACSSTMHGRPGGPASAGSPSWSSRPSTPASWGGSCRAGACSSPTRAIFGPGRRADVGGTGGEDRHGLPGRAIVTWLHANRRGRLETDVLVRADGTPWPFDLPITPPGAGRDGDRTGYWLTSPTTRTGPHVMRPGPGGSTTATAAGPDDGRGDREPAGP